MTTHELDKARRETLKAAVDALLTGFPAEDIIAALSTACALRSVTQAAHGDYDYASRLNWISDDLDGLETRLDNWEPPT